MNNKTLCRLLVAGVCFLPCLAMPAKVYSADWRQFRGNNNNPVAAGASLPQHWSEKENIAWKVSLPGRGLSSPIVVQNRAILTCSDGVRQDRLIVLCIDTVSGKQLWQRNFWATGRTITHPTSAVAVPSPASDGKRIFAFFSSNDLICLDLDGNLLWYRGLSHDYPKAGNDIGMASSPLVIEDTVIVQIENQGDSFAAGINTATGQTRWRIDRDPRANWASPTVLPGQGKRKNVVLLQSPAGLSAHQPRSGKVLWTFAAPCADIASVVATKNRVYLPANGLTVLQFNDQSNAPEVLWESSKVSPGSASPVIHKGKIYTLKGGVITCANAETGKSNWKLRIQGRHWATPIVTDDYLYCINQDGAAKIVELGEKGKIVGQAEFGEAVYGTPAVVENAMYVRSAGHLWKITSSGNN